MNGSQIYIITSILILVIIAILFFFTNKNKTKKRLSGLASLSFGLIITGIVFGDNRLVGYSLIGAGVVFAIIDIFIKNKDK
ncbi:MAG: hypothetical protein CL609_06025 [Anaerolineaceae bacterium]|nr:hypothetical protein [Anaerolineaceae bacterium]